jgi:hypothetical protein
MTTNERLTNGQRAILLGWAALAAVGRGLAWLLVLGLVLAGLDGLLPRKRAAVAPAPVLETAAPASMDPLMVAAPAAPAPVLETAAAPMAHPWALAIETAAPATVKGLRAMAREQGVGDWRRASRCQLVASLYALA